MAGKPSLSNRAVDWLDERMGIRRLLELALVEPVPGGARFRYVFGSVLAYLFMQQVVLGILLAFYYSPSASDAWASTAYIQDRVTMGWFLRGLHHHGSSAMVITVLLHTAQVVLAGAYRKPRELNWWAGLAMGGLVLAFALTGYLLPWDQKGYWATQVATGIMGSVPGGEPLQHLVQGGTEYGNLTITRFYAVHVFVLPITLGALLALHIYLFRRHGVTPPAQLSEAELGAKEQPFWPNQLFLDVLAMALTAGVLVALTVNTHGAELFAPADPASNFVARPEWYFLFLFQLLKYFEGPLSIIATVIIPGGITIGLLALPFVDRSKDRRAVKRLPVLIGMGALFAFVAVLTALAIVEDAGNEKFQKGLTLAHERAEEARHWAADGVLPEGGSAVFKNDPKYQVRRLFEDRCATCHEVDSRGGNEAPSLTGYGSRQWLSGVVRSPASEAYFGGTKNHSTMEAYDEDMLDDAQLAAVVEYMISLRAAEGDEWDEKLAAKGAQLWEESDPADCGSCHEVEKGAQGAGAPTLAGRGSVDWIARVIRDSGQADIFGEDAEMPKFEGKLSDEEIMELAKYVFAQGQAER